MCTSSSDNLKKGGPQACNYYNPLSVYSRNGEKTFASARQEIPDVVDRLVTVTGDSHMVDSLLAGVLICMLGMLSTGRHPAR